MIFETFVVGDYVFTRITATSGQGRYSLTTHGHHVSTNPKFLPSKDTLHKDLKAQLQYKMSFPRGAFDCLGNHVVLRVKDPVAGYRSPVVVADEVFSVQTVEFVRALQERGTKVLCISTAVYHGQPSPVPVRFPDCKPMANPFTWSSGFKYKVCQKLGNYLMSLGREVSFDGVTPTYVGLEFQIMEALVRRFKQLHGDSPYTTGGGEGTLLSVHYKPHNGPFLLL